ncbi:MAG: hypothetical protein INH34_15050 [Phycisphaerales bacterium]|nr:hypothetical protein [Phycisphaerales bacterium]
MTSNTFGNAPPDPSTRSPGWLWPFAPMAVAAFSLSALVFYHLRHEGFEVRSALQHAYAALYRTFGFAPAVMFFGLVVLWSTIWLVHGRLDRPLQRLGRLAAMAVLLGVLLNLGEGGVAPALHKGALGAWLAGAMVAAVGYWPTLVVIWGFTFASLLLATDFFFHESFERMFVGGPVERASAPTIATAAAGAPSLAPAPAAESNPSEPASEGGTPPADDAPAWRRRSYYERRAERVASSARWSEPGSAAGSASTADAAAAIDAADAASGAPAAAQDDALSAARVVAAIDAAERKDAAAVDAEEAEALDRGDDAASAAASDAAPARAPIVFPDATEPPRATGFDAAVEWSAAAALGASAAEEVGPELHPGPHAVDAVDATEAVPPSLAAAVRFDGSPWRDEVTDAPAAGDADAAIGAESTAGVTDATTAADAEVPALANDDARWPAGGNDAEAAADGMPTRTEPWPDAETARSGSDAIGMGPAAGTAAAAPAEEPIRHDAEASTPPATVSLVAPADTEDPIVTIPRPEPAIASRPGAPDEVLMREAVELVLATRRANAVFLQRKLRIDYDLAAAVLVELAARGIVALDAEATHGRILV